MRSIRLLTYPNANLLDVSGPLQVFASASSYAIEIGVAAAPSYDISLLSMEGGAVLTSASVSVETQKADIRPVDTLLIAGGHGADAARADPALISWIRAQAAQARRTASICTGAFVLAQTGLLNGKRATTHWNYCDAMAREFPAVTLMPDAVFVEDGDIWTSAGVLAGIDMAMAMVERDLGRRMADYTARALVATSRRSVGEAQISAQLQAQETEVGRIRKVMEWIADNPRADLSTSALAERAALSTRSLHRHFQSEARQTPADFVERARVAAARRLLTKTDRALERVATGAGFGSQTAMRRAFVRVVGVTPTQYRKSLAPPAS